jgi:hypothetical protein
VILNELAEFAWNKPEDGAGFTWDPRRYREGALVASPGDHPWKRYAPLREEPALFRVFAATDPTPGGVVAFANRYGRLGPTGKHVADEGDAFAEPFGTWRLEILKMRDLTSLWDMLRANDVAGLRERVRWERARVVYLRPADSDGPRPIASMKPPGQSEEVGIRPGDPVRPAWAYLAGKVNLAMSGLVMSPLVYDRGHEHPVLRLRPANLLGALWAQFARAIDGDKQYRQCPACGTWMEISPAPGLTNAKSYRTSRKTCSDKCRVWVHRQHQERARELHAAGKTAKQIAKELGSDVDTVKKWVSKRKG